MKFKYTGQKTIISQHGISFKQGKEDKYIFFPFVYEILKALNNNYESTKNYSYDIKKEELNIEISVDKFAIDIEYQYPNFYLFMSCFMCSIKEGSIELLEHNDGKWITKEELNTLNWLPADIDAVNYLKENM